MCVCVLTDTYRHHVHIRINEDQNRTSDPLSSGVGGPSDNLSLQNSVMWVLGTNCKFSVWLMKTGIITCTVKSETVKYEKKTLINIQRTPFQRISVI